MWLVIAGLVLIGNHSVQLYRVTIGIIGMVLRPMTDVGLQDQGLSQSIVYYGALSGLIEALTLVTFGVFLLRRNVRASRILLWVLPLLISHDIAYAAVIGVPFSDAALSIVLDTAAWLALFQHRLNKPTSPA